MDAMIRLDKNLVNEFNTDKVLYGCEHDTTWGLIRKNNFPQAFSVNIAFIFLKEENDEFYIFNVLAPDGKYQYANYAEVNKKSGAVKVFNH